jgi:hypothetical protein
MTSPSTSPKAVFLGIAILGGLVTALTWFRDDAPLIAAICLVASLVNLGVFAGCLISERKAKPQAES